MFSFILLTQNKSKFIILLEGYKLEVNTLSSKGYSMQKIKGGKTVAYREEPKEEVVKFPAILTNEKLEAIYVGLLILNPKGIGMFYLEYEECQFSVPWMLNIYKIVLFREGQSYASEAAKRGFSFPKINDKVDTYMETCKKYALDSEYTIEQAYFEIRKLFLLKMSFANAPTKTIQQKVIAIKKYDRYNEMGIDEIINSLNQISFTSSIRESVLNEGITGFLLEGNNNLKTGIATPFPILTRTFKGFRKGETGCFAMPSNAGKSRFITNIIAYLVYVEKKKVLLLSNEMTEDKMKLCLITTILNAPFIQKLHGQVLHKREAELLALKFRPNEGVEAELDDRGFILRKENETDEEFFQRLSEISDEFVKTTTATNWLEEQTEASIFFVHTSDHTNDELRNIIMDYYYKEGIEYYFYDTLKTDINNIGNGEEIKKTATVLSTLAQSFNLFIGSTLQLNDNATTPLNMSINDIQSSRTVKEVLDNLCLIKEINNSTYDQYEYSLEEDGDNVHYQDLEAPDTANTKYYACVVDKNRAGSKPKLLFKLDLDYNMWIEKGYVRLKQQV